MKTLLDPLNNSCGVVTRGQLVRQMDPQECGAVYPPHLKAADGQREMVPVTSPTEVNSHH